MGGGGGGGGALSHYVGESIWTNTLLDLLHVCLVDDPGELSLHTRHVVGGGGGGGGGGLSWLMDG